jgi:3-deoxy-D-manno-octulosonic-acid transferase
MSIALDFLYIAALVIFSPLLLYRLVRTGKYREGWREKFSGKAPPRSGDEPCLWFHAVSVGEVHLLRPLVEEMARRRPGWTVVISTTSSAGLRAARRTFPDLVTFYAPLDFSWATRRAVARIRPTVLSLVELEVWPNLIRAAKRSGAKVAIVNGRLSSRSFRWYLRIRGILSTTFRHIDGVAAQNAEYAQRFIDLGVPSQRVRVTGSVKYDGVECDRNNAKTRALRTLLGLSPSDLVFVAGSTMEGEEAAVLAAYRAARREHQSLRLIIVPRHAERFDHVARWLEKQGEVVLRRSQLPAPAPTPRRGSSAIILIDTIGELAAVWGLADAAFVGGSLLRGRGGQNMIEPAAYGAAVMFGPHTTNFRDTVEQLLERDAARQVADADELTECLLDYLDDPETAAARGQAGRNFVLSQNGAAGRTLYELDRLVESSLASGSA